MSKTKRNRDRIRRHNREEAEWEERYAYYDKHGVWPTNDEAGPKRKRYAKIDEDQESIPSWWWNLTTTRRRRTEARVKAHKAKNLDIEDLKEFDFPTNWNKPEEYYW